MTLYWWDCLCSGWRWQASLLTGNWITLGLGVICCPSEGCHPSWDLSHGKNLCNLMFFTKIHSDQSGGGLQSH